MMRKLRDQPDWNTIGFVVASKYRRKVIGALQKGEKTPKAMSIETSIRLNHLSNVLRRLAEKGLVLCLTPRRKKGRIYTLTDEGKKIASIMERIEKSEGQD